MVNYVWLATEHHGYNYIFDDSELAFGWYDTQIQGFEDDAQFEELTEYDDLTLISTAAYLDGETIAKLERVELNNC